MIDAYYWTFSPESDFESRLSFEKISLLFIFFAASLYSFAFSYTIVYICAKCNQIERVFLFLAAASIISNVVSIPWIPIMFSVYRILGIDPAFALDGFASLFE